MSASPRKPTPRPAPKVKPRKLARPQEPLWKGPIEDGITFSLLSDFLVCRERFRLQVVEGLKEDEGFNVPLEYGNYWHEMEEAYYSAPPARCSTPLDAAYHAAARYRLRLLQRYPADQVEIDKWFSICKYQFEQYVRYWSEHPDENRHTILTEKAFRVPYKLPSGRTITLRGKFDAVFTTTLTKREWLALDPSLPPDKHNPKRPPIAIFIQENKGKGRIDEDGILHTVSQNLQTMIYQTALAHFYEPGSHDVRWAGSQGIDLSKAVLNYPLAGTLYNVIRRPLADNFAIKQRKGREDKKSGKRIGVETPTMFYKRVGQGIADEVTEALRTGKPSTNFMRWKSIVTPNDLALFQTRCLNPILEQLLDWWEWIAADPFNPWEERPTGTLRPWGAYSNDCPIPNYLHYQTPWGIYNSMFGGFRGDYFNYLTRGSDTQLTRIDTLYPELPSG